MSSSERLKIKVVPGASSSEICGWLGDALKVRVSAPPEKGKANRLVESMVAKALAVPESSVRIVAGKASPQKVMEVDGLTIHEIRTRIESEEGCRGICAARTAGNDRGSEKQSGGVGIRAGQDQGCPRRHRPGGDDCLSARGRQAPDSGRRRTDAGRRTAGRQLEDPGQLEYSGWLGSPGDAAEPDECQGH